MPKKNVLNEALLAWIQDFEEGVGPECRRHERLAGSRSTVLRRILKIRVASLILIFGEVLCEFVLGFIQC